MATNLSNALKYAAAGIAIFPCGANKRPLVDNWLASASSDPRTIESWWQQHPDAVIGLPLKPLDLLVLDADRHHEGSDGVEHLRKLCAEHGEFPLHPWCTTANHGEHHYFRQPEAKIGNKKIGDGLETRGFKADNDGGYVIASGSMLTDGRKWWRGDGSPSLLESYQADNIPVVPAWLLNGLRPQPAPEVHPAAVVRGHTNGSREAAYAGKALDGIAAELASAGPGGRNNALNAAAFRMGTMIARGWIGRAEVGDALIAACHANGLVKDDGPSAVQGTLASGLRGGEQQPHADLADKYPDGSSPGLGGVLPVTEIPAQLPDAGDELAGRALEPAAAAITGLGETDAGYDTDVPPPRGWLLGNTFCRKFLSSLLADGGVGKTALRYAQMLSLATGRPLTGEHVFQRCRVLIISLEDDIDELRRRILAAMIYHQISREEIAGWLFYCSPGRGGGKLMTIDKTGHAIVGELTGKIEAAVKTRQIDVVMLDPFVKSHSVEENHNSLIDEVAQLLTDLASKHNIAADAPHHTSKGTAEPGNADRGRGASSMKDAARLVYTLTPMNTDEAKAFGLNDEDRWQYIRVDSGKVNITRHLGAARWFRLTGVALGNATEMYPNGDEVQTVEPWNSAGDLGRSEQRSSQQGPDHDRYRAS